MRLNPWKKRDWPSISVDQYLNELLGFAGNTYPLSAMTSYTEEKQEEPNPNFEGYVQAGYKSNGPVFACMLARLLLFSEARFQAQRMRNGRPGDLWNAPDLAILEKPWPNGTTGDLLARMEQDVSAAGNSYTVRRGGRLRRLRPDWVSIVLGASSDDPLAERDLLGYAYYEGGRRPGKEPTEVLLPDEVAHYAPIPDPVANYRGMSWLTPVVREMMADSAATTHKLKFFENGATPNLAVKLDPKIQLEAYKKWVDLFEEKFGGNNGGAYLKAYQTLYLGGGADVTVVGANMRQIDFKTTQGAGETRIAAAAGVPPVIVGLSEGLQSATYSNYAQARRRFADMTMRPLWRNAAGSLATIVKIPSDSRLWYDDRDIPALREDEDAAAKIQQTRAISIKTLIDAGFDPDTAIEAVTSGDFGHLTHSGLYSVQLQPKGGVVSEGKGSLDEGVVVPAKDTSGAEPAQADT